LMHSALLKWCDSRPFSMLRVIAPVGHRFTQVPQVAQSRWSIFRLAQGKPAS